MGLKMIRHMLRDSTIQNKDTVQHYLQSCTRKLGLRSTKFKWPNIKELHERPTSLEEAILIGLAVHRRNASSQLSTTQIAHKLNQVFAGSMVKTNKNNVSRYFNFKPHPFYKVNNEDGVLKYSLSATGLSRAFGLVNSRRP